jgi:tRNA (guanine37-N1)-methyltransferase
MPAFEYITLFPEIFEGFFAKGLLSRAIAEEKVNVRTTQLRDFAINTHGQVDDNPYGGGSGMVLRVESGAAAIRVARARYSKSKVILLTPRGKVFNQKLAHALAKEVEGETSLIFLCTRYEGVDERIAENFVDEQICIGDYILMGGEIPSMVLTEAIVRLLPGVLGNPDSPEHESFEDEELEHAQYTKPQEFEKLEVPEALLTGHHAEIEKYRAKERKRDTAKRRPDLITAPISPLGELSMALIHYPVLNKRGDIVASSITNIDLHDMARSAKTFGIEHFYAAHPTRAMRKLSENICRHWSEGYGLTYNPNRSEALAIISIVPEFEDILLSIEERTGRIPRVVATTARKSATSIPYSAFRAELLTSDTPHLLIFGTGWGLAPQLMERADVILDPVIGPGEYNHLSVRAATAIILDKLLGSKL